MNNPSKLASQNSKEKNICNKGRRTHFALNGGQFEHLSGTTLAWVPWIPGNPRIFQKVYKELKKFEEGKIPLIWDT